MTRIAGVASAFPRQYYRQQEIADALQRHWGKGLDNPKVLERLLTRVGVDGRYLALPIQAYDDLLTWGKSNDAWIEVAEDLAEQSICRALTRAGLCEADLDAVFFVSVTGVASPSIDARLMNRMNLRSDIDVDAFLANNGLVRSDIDGWIMHTGGPKVLEATAEVLELPEGSLDLSWQCLRRVGNLSSASVLLVLEEFMNRCRPTAGSHSLVAAMGPGFCSELVLLRW